jgi:hypothetical protein
MCNTWPLALHERFLTTSTIRFLHMSCFLTLLRPLLLSLLFILLTIHLMLHGKVSDAPTLLHSTGMKLLLHHVKFHHITEVMFLLLTSLYVDSHLVVIQWRHLLQNNK